MQTVFVSLDNLSKQSNFIEFSLTEAEL